MDFDDEMSSLQIEDLGEYFFPNDLPNDNWKGFSLGYGEEDATTAAAASSSSSASKPIAIARSTSHSRDRSGSLSNSLSGIGLSLGALVQDPSLLVSPPSALASSFSDMLKQTNGALTAAAMGLDATDFAMAPAAAAATPRTKDEQLMDLTNFTLEGRLQRKPTPQPLLPQPVPRSAAIAKAAPLKVAADGSNATAVCKRIMDEDDEEEEDEDEDEDDDTYRAKRRASSEKATAFGSKRSFDMVESRSTSSCATIVAPEDDRGFRKKSREKMRRQEVNVKFDELIELLGLSNRVRKSAILHEAVSAIKSLQRERDEMRRDRDRLQQEVSKLATCLQYSHLGSVAAANAAAAMSQHPFQPQLAPMHMNTPHQMPGPGCFPIGGATFSATLAAAAATATPSNATPIAPKVLKSASDSSAS